MSALTFGQTLTHTHTHLTLGGAVTALCSTLQFGLICIFLTLCFVLLNKCLWLLCTLGGSSELTLVLFLRKKKFSHTHTRITHKVSKCCGHVLCVWIWTFPHLSAVFCISITSYNKIYFILKCHICPIWLCSKNDDDDDDVLICFCTMGLDCIWLHQLISWIERGGKTPWRLLFVQLPTCVSFFFGKSVSI